jgi:ketosteroid isomerase-like protein
MNYKSFMAVAVTSLSFALIAGCASAQGPVSPPYAVQDETVASADQVAIIDLIARMNQAIDANDYVSYAGFYTEDGVIDSGFGTPVTGRPAIVASLEQSAPFITNKRHVAANVVINGQGDLATAVYYLTVFERQAGLTLAGTALITDEFRRGSGGWQVVRHTTRMDPATLAAMSAAMAGAAAQP